MLLQSALAGCCIVVCCCCRGHVVHAAADQSDVIEPGSAPAGLAGHAAAAPPGHAGPVAVLGQLAAAEPHSILLLLLPRFPPPPHTHRWRLRWVWRVTTSCTWATTSTQTRRWPRSTSGEGGWGDGRWRPCATEITSAATPRWPRLASGEGGLGGLDSGLCACRSWSAWWWVGVRWLTVVSLC